MTIEKAIDRLEDLHFEQDNWEYGELTEDCLLNREALRQAIDIMRKYQKIQEIYQKWNEVNDFEYNQIVTPDHHPDYVLIHQDEMKRSYATFRVPKDFNIGEIHFVDRYIIPKNNMLNWDNFGDYMTILYVFCYRGKLFYAEDYGDAGSWGDHHFGLFKWNKEKTRYELLAEIR